MTEDEIITQLQDLKCHCQEMYEAEIKNGDTSSSIWGKDVEALDMGIQALEQTRWIPVSERLPEELEPVNITWINHNPESYYTDIKDKPFTATGVYFNGQWYWWSTLCNDILAEYSHNYDDIIDDDIDIIAWQPLPQPYVPDTNVGEIGESEDKE